MFNNAVEACSHLFTNGVTVVNSTPHPITIQDVNGELISIESSPDFLLINAKVKEVSSKTSMLFVKTTFEGDEDGIAKIDSIGNYFKEKGGDEKVVIVGSIIAAQAYPGKVFGLCPVPGYERVAPAEKRMRCDKFTTFGE